MGFGEYSNKSTPDVYQKILPRSGVAQVLDGAAQGEAVCLTAPYGCGKTLAVTSWLRGHDMQASWAILQEKDNAAPEFIAAMASAVLSTGKNELLSNPLYLKDPGAFLLEAVSPPDEEGRERILVIDNFHFVSDMTLLRFAKEFISACFGRWRVVMISRTELPPAFNDLVLKGHIRMVTPKELNFSLREMADYFIMNGFGVSERDIARIHSETEGWPAAANAILTASHGASISYGETARDYIMTFFEAEIWNGLKEDTKDFLLKTSVLDTLTPSSCYAVTGISGTLPVLKWLFINGLFISKLEEEHAFRYHHVFRDFLLRKLSELDIDKSKLYTKIAWWFFEKGEAAQSFPYFFKAGDFYGVTQVLKILNPAEMGIERYLEMAGCITTLDTADLKTHPIIVARMSMINFLLGDLAEMRRLYVIFTEWLESGELLITPEEYGEYIWEAGWLNYVDPSEAVLKNKKHEEWSNYEEYIPHLKPIHFQRFAVLRLPSALSGIRDYCSVVDTIDMFIRYNEETGRSVIRGEYALCEMELISAEYAYETENFAKAEDAVRKVMALSESRQHTDLYFVCTSLLVNIMRAMNNTKDIDRIINRLEAIIVNNKHHFLLPNFHAFELRNSLSCGHSGFSEIFLEENESYKDKPYYYLIYRHITYARGLLSLGSYSEAMLLLGNLEVICNKYSRTMDWVEVNILKAIASHGLGYEDKACVHLGEALGKVEKYGFIRVFSDNAPDIWHILERIKKHTNSKYVQNVTISCKKMLSNSGHKLPAKKYAHIELTKTELKILKSLRADMSYMEIALDNNISMSTVKSHVHSIYSKLDVSNKTSAVIAAKNQGIIE